MVEVESTLHIDTIQNGDSIQLIGSEYIAEVTISSEASHIELEDDNHKYIATVSIESIGTAIEETFEYLSYKSDLNINGKSADLNILSEDSNYDTTLVLTPLFDYGFSAAHNHDNRYIRKDVEDYASSPITFKSGLFISSKDSPTAYIDKQGVGVFTSLKTSSFRKDGFLGEGFGMWEDNGDSHIELDYLTVRRSFNVYELLINKIRSIGGRLVISAANGKVKSVESDESYYILSFVNDECDFDAGDLVRCQVFNGTNVKSYWVTVDSIHNNKAYILKSAFDGQSLPESNDEVVSFGNTSIPERQGLIMLDAVEDGRPRMSMYSDVTSKDITNNNLRVRVGYLGDIEDEDNFPKALGYNPQGYGLYADNVYLKGKFILSSNGKDISTLFSIMDGQIKSSITEIRKDFTDTENYLTNGSFENGLMYWNINDTVSFFTANDYYLWINDAPYSVKGNYAADIYDSGRYTVFLKNNYVLQKKESYSTIPTYEKDKDGLYIPKTVYLKFFYKCTSAGRLTITFEDLDKTGFEDFTPFSVSQDIAVGDGSYITLDANGLWNGTGNFKIAFTGEIYISNVMLSTDRISELDTKFTTEFKQTADAIELAANAFSIDKSTTPPTYKLLATSGLVINPNKAGLYVVNGETGGTAYIGAFIEGSSTVVLLKGDYIRLEGDITANGNVNISTDGKLTAVDGTFSGKITSNKGQIGAFYIDEDSNKLGYLYAGFTGSDTDAKSKDNCNILITSDGKLYVKDGYFSGEIQASTGKIGDLTIYESSIGSGEKNNYFKTTIEAGDDMLYFNTGQLKLVRTNSYGGSLYAAVKIGLGTTADPSVNSSFIFTDDFNGLACYIESFACIPTSQYIPAVKIKRKFTNSFEGVAINCEGAVITDYGLFSGSEFVTESYSVLDFIKGTNTLIYTTTYRVIYLPKISVIRQILGITDTTKTFGFPVSIINRYDSTNKINLAFQDNETTLYFLGPDNGSKWHTTVDIGPGDVVQLMIIFDGTNYYGQLLNHLA
jgi:hypothetical protein